MPDLILHGASTYLVAKGLRLLAPAALIGAMLPDLLRAPGLSNLMAWRFFGPLHEPLPVFLACVLLSRLFEKSLRGQALAGLSTGGALHLILDMGQDHLGYGYYPLFPFSNIPLEFGFYPPEGYFWIGPLLCVPCWVLQWRRRRA